MRRAVAASARPQAKHKLFPAPVRGLVLVENLAASGGASALVLDNWFPTKTGIRVRGGSTLHATVGATDDPVKSLFTYVGAASEKMFAACDGNIYDITTPADSAVIPTAAVTGRTADYYSTEHIGTVGGDYLYAVNGADLALLFDGATWTPIDGASTPAITGATTSEFSHVWGFKSRLFFVRGGTLDSYYLPVDSVGGAAQKFSLAGVFKKGGSLLFGASWTVNLGNVEDERCVFVSTEGEVAVYQGTDPSSASTWAIVGRYEITKPQGQNATMHAGGDLLIATEGGVVPMSEIATKDPAALSAAAVSRPIEPMWTDLVSDRQDVPWEIAKWPAYNMAIFTAPNTTGVDPKVLCVNLHTGAWARYTGWDARCVTILGRKAYFGTNTGVVVQCEVGGSDMGSIYVCKFSGSFDHFGSPAVHKNIEMARGTFLTKTPIDPEVSVTFDYETEFPSAPNAAAIQPSSGWDEGFWDISMWDADATQRAVLPWVSVGGDGISAAPQVQISVGSTGRPMTELVAIDILYQTGGIVV